MPPPRPEISSPISDTAATDASSTTFVSLTLDEMANLIRSLTSFLAITTSISNSVKQLDKEHRFYLMLTRLDRIATLLITKDSSDVAAVMYSGSYSSTAVVGIVERSGCGIPEQPENCTIDSSKSGITEQSNGFTTGQSKSGMMEDSKSCTTGQSKNSITEKSDSCTTDQLESGITDSSTTESPRSNTTEEPGMKIYLLSRTLMATITIQEEYFPRGLLLALRK